MVGITGDLTETGSHNLEFQALAQDDPGPSSDPKSLIAQHQPKKVPVVSSAYHDNAAGITKATKSVGGGVAVTSTPLRSLSANNEHPSTSSFGPGSPAISFASGSASKSSPMPGSGSWLQRWYRAMPLFT